MFVGTAHTGHKKVLNGCKLSECKLPEIKVYVVYGDKFTGLRQVYARGLREKAHRTKEN